jgi:hypothetical protein
VGEAEHGVPEDKATASVLNNNAVEVLIRPVDVSLAIASGQRVKGDCDDFSQYAACLLWALQVPCVFVTVAADTKYPNVYSHVYVASYQDGERKVLDCSHGLFSGWEVPNRFGKLKEWDIVQSAAENESPKGLILLLAFAGGLYLAKKEGWV